MLQGHWLSSNDLLITLMRRYQAHCIVMICSSKTELVALDSATVNSVWNVWVKPYLKKKRRRRNWKYTTVCVFPPPTVWQNRKHTHTASASLDEVLMRFSFLRKNRRLVKKKVNFAEVGKRRKITNLYHHVSTSTVTANLSILKPL